MLAFFCRERRMAEILQSENRMPTNMRLRRPDQGLGRQTWAVYIVRANSGQRVATSARLAASREIEKNGEELP
jgi:hypothetical protein